MDCLLPVKLGIGRMARLEGKLKCSGDPYAMLVRTWFVKAPLIMSQATCRFSTRSQPQTGLSRPARQRWIHHNAQWMFPCLRRVTDRYSIAAERQQ